MDDHEDRKCLLEKTNQNNQKKKADRLLDSLAMSFSLSYLDVYLVDVARVAYETIAREPKDEGPDENWFLLFSFIDVIRWTETGHVNKNKQPNRQFGQGQSREMDRTGRTFPLRNGTRPTGFDGA